MKPYLEDFAFCLNLPSLLGFSSSPPLLVDISSLPLLVDISSSEDESHSISHISGLQGSQESSREEATSSNSEKVEAPLRMVPQASRLAGSKAPIPLDLASIARW